MGFKSSSTFIKVSLFLCISAFVFTCIGIFSPSWLMNEALKIQVGVFYKCVDGDCSGGDSSESQTWQKAVAAMEILGILLAVPCLIFVVLFIFVPVTSGKTWVKVTTLSLAYGAGVLILIGVIVCVAKKDDFPELAPGYRLSFDVSWSFAMTIIAGMLYLSTGVFFTLDMIFNASW
ncbi:epithelial membrane protein 1-like [Littorina saxatilis]|uniref:Uncharacterized protein n=1 Tax=Littorina saxatilis TaxID=31220 RepID=A0AAN9GD90_9CAEN